MGEKRAVIFVNGVLKDLEAVRRLLHEGDYLVAADGGMRHMESMGLAADLVIGDLDSLTPKQASRLRAAGIEVRQFPREKDQTDLELALEAVLGMGYRRILIIAALGSRVDQTLGNLMLLTLPDLSHCDIRLDDGEVEAFLIQDDGAISGEPGDIVSLIPLNGAVTGIGTSGLRYALEDETLVAGRTRGISNEMQGTKASIRIKQGRLLCIHTRKGVE
jgi:thiamine pyrophosphokinase